MLFVFCLGSFCLFPKLQRCWCLSLSFCISGFYIKSVIYFELDLRIVWDFWMLSQPYIHGVNPIWSWYSFYTAWASTWYFCKYFYVCPHERFGLCFLLSFSPSAFVFVKVWCEDYTGQIKQVHFLYFLNYLWITGGILFLNVW